MYPNLYYAFQELFGISVPFLKAINSVGFFIAIAFIPGAWMWKRELKRKEKRGELTYRTITVTVGAPAPLSRLLLHFILGFIAGYKLLYLVVHGNTINPSNFIFSAQGSFIGGLLTGCISAIVTWLSSRSQQLAEPVQQTVKIWPHECVPAGIIVAGIAGVIGAKIFGIAENWSSFIKAPLQNLFSSKGFAFLGGLIVATFAMWWYHYKWKYQRMQMADALAPSLLLSYSLGRLGCQIGGDGDWGITNPLPNPYSLLPDWLWSYDYPHNVARMGIYMKDCSWDDFCYRLPVPVYPTPLYELIAGMVLFFILLLIRKKIKLAGRTSAFYLMFCGTERFFIEKIRVDIRYSIFGFHPTQAEILSVVLFVAGLILYFVAPHLNANRHLIRGNTTTRS